MGCCCSKREKEPPFVLQTVNYGTVDCGAGLQINLSAAGWLSRTPLLQQVAVTAGSDYSIAFLLSELHHEEYQAARQQAVEVFRHSLLNSEGHVQDALECTHRAIGGHLGPGCLLLCIHHANQAVYLTAGLRSLGGASLSHLQHGLAAQYTSADFLRFPGMYSQAPPQPDELCTTRHQLLPSHESILLGSRGLWEALDKDDAALHTHFHLKGFSGGEVRPRPLPSFTADGSTAPALPDIQAGLSPSGQPVAPELLPSTARHLVVHACDKACKQTFAPLMRQDVIALCITLRWPMTSLNHAYQDRTMSLLDRYPVPESRAVKLWRLVRALCVDCRRARRHMLVRKWREVVRQEVRAATARAKQLETRAWLEKGVVVQVSPGGKARDESGRSVNLSGLLAPDKAGISAIH